jgi:CO/xanthine dehydrogenase Mo-binding subunit
MGSQLPAGVTIREVTQKCAEEAGWTHGPDGWKKPELAPSEDANIKRGLGIACGYKNIGFSYGAPENCGATIILEGDVEIEKAKLFHAGAEVGQGSHSAFAQFAAEALDLPLEKLEFHYSDTSNSLNSGSVSASRMTHMAGNSIIGAAKLALENWQAGERPAIGSYVYRPPATGTMDKFDGHCTPNFTYGYVAQAVFADVNILTGEVRLRDVISVDDVGKAINPMQVEGQIEGCVVQAAGYVILENWKKRNTRALTKELSTYLIPTVLDIPDRTRSVILEYPDPIGPYGARGMGEMPYLPFAPAVIDAVHHATGIRFHSFPLTAERVLRGLGKLKPEVIGFWDYE